MGLRSFEAAMKAAADPTRMRILKMLEGGEVCVCQILGVLEPLSASTVSKHLFVLRAAGLVRDRKEGRWVLYSLEGDKTTQGAAAVLALLRGVLAADPAVRRDRGRLARARRSMGPEACASRGGRAAR